MRTGRQLGRGWWSGSAIKNREAQKIAFHITAVAETVLFCFVFSLSLSRNEGEMCFLGAAIALILYRVD